MENTTPQSQYTQLFPPAFQMQRLYPSHECVYRAAEPDCGHVCRGVGLVVWPPTIILATSHEAFGDAALGPIMLCPFMLVYVCPRSSHSNDDLALRQLLCRNGVLQLENGDKDSETRAAGIIKFRGQAVARLKLSPAEIAVLCWERGLLRSQHWSRGTLRRSAVDHEVPAAEVQAMLKR